MGDETGRIQADPVFLALTRPAIVIGVTYSWFVVEALFWMVFFINAKSFTIMIPGALITHGIGFLACSHEPRFLEILKVWGITNSHCPNRRYHGNTYSYDLY